MVYSMVTVHQRELFMLNVKVESIGWLFISLNKWCLLFHPCLCLHTCLSNARIQ